MSASAAKTRRRVLHFDSVDDVAAEVERIVAAQHAGHLEALGNWSAAQIFEHLAKFIEFSYEGFPFRARWPLRAVSYLAKWIAWKRFVDFALRPGHRIPAYADALQPDAWADFDVATARLHAALVRIRRGQPMRAPSPFEGTISHQQWVYVHLRHAELHLSFLDPRER
jgi:Protein of unknown function (DUF1569)